MTGEEIAPLGSNAECGLDGRLTEAERARVVSLMAETEAEFLALLDGVSEAQWPYRPSEHEWSIAMTAEHIMLSERSIFLAVRKALHSPVAADWQSRPSRTEFLERALPVRGGKGVSPEALRPTGTTPREEIIERFCRSRAESRRFAETTDLPLKQHSLQHPFFGEMNGHDWLICVPLHQKRHNLQIAGVKESAGYPR